MGALINGRDGHWLFYKYDVLSLPVRAHYEANIIADVISTAPRVVIRFVKNRYGYAFEGCNFLLPDMPGTFEKVKHLETLIVLDDKASFWFKLKFGV